MNRKLRNLLAPVAMCMFLIFGFASTAAAACPKVGTTWYSSQQCARGPCYMYKVTGTNADLDIYSVAVYANGYYRWVHVKQIIYSC